MTKQNKFRAWDTDLNKFATVASMILLRSNPTNPVYAFYDERFVLQQFTGLIDEKGVEIYEGDILRVVTYGDWLDDETFTRNIEVKFEQKEFGDTDGCGWIYIPKKREVIGNIFETPELLKK